MEKYRFHSFVIDCNRFLGTTAYEYCEVPYLRYRCHFREPPIENLGLSASKFTCVRSTIKNFLKEKVAGEEQNTTQGLKRAEEENRESSENCQEVVAGVSTSKKFKTEKTTIKTFFKEIPAGQEISESRQVENTQVDIFGEDEVFVADGVEFLEKVVMEKKSLVNEDTQSEESNDAGEVGHCVADSVTKGNKGTKGSHSSDAEAPNVPSKSFFAKMLAQKITEGRYLYRAKL